MGYEAGKVGILHCRKRPASHNEGDCHPVSQLIGCDLDFVYVLQDCTTAAAGAVAVIRFSVASLLLPVQCFCLSSKVSFVTFGSMLSQNNRLACMANAAVLASRIVPAMPFVMLFCGQTDLLVGFGAIANRQKGGLASARGDSYRPL